MANGVEISNAWKAWITSDAGKQASDPNSLGTTLSARNYLENRLHNAFMAGAEAAQDRGAGRDTEQFIRTVLEWERDYRKRNHLAGGGPDWVKWGKKLLAAEPSQPEGK